MDAGTLINIATPISGIIVAWVGLLLTRKKNIEDKVSALQESSNKDREWLRGEVNQLRSDNKELNLEILTLKKENRKLKSLCEKHGLRMADDEGAEV